MRRTGDYIYGIKVLGCNVQIREGILIRFRRGTTLDQRPNI